MTRTFVAMSVILAFAAVLVGALFATGVIHKPGSNDTGHPACEQLPPLAQVKTGIAEHTDLVREIEATGPLVTVRATSPCRVPER